MLTHLKSFLTVAIVVSIACLAWYYPILFIPIVIGLMYMFVFSLFKHDEDEL